jgi:hypothetical protein
MIVIDSAKERIMLFLNIYVGTHKIKADGVDYSITRKILMIFRFSECTLLKFY